MSFKNSEFSIVPAELKVVMQRNWPGLLWVGIVIFVFLLSARYVRVSVDDLFIVLRYVENAANGHGFVYNIGERVEGYTCFGWVLCLTGLVRLGWPAYWAAKLIGLMCSIITLWLCYGIGREFWRGSRIAAFLPVVLLAATPDFLYWSVSGLETPVYSTAVMAVLYLLVLETRLAREQHSMRWLIVIGQALLCGTATLMRPEGVALLAYALVAKLVMWKAKQDGLRHCLVLGVTAALPIGIYFLWRHHYYGEWLPMTFYAKTGGAMLDRLHSGKLYLFEFLSANAFGWLGRHGNTAWPGVAMFLMLPVCAVPFIRKKRAHLMVLGWVILSVLIVLWEGGDWMPKSRFFIPALGCWMLLVAHSAVELIVWVKARIRGFSKHMAMVAMGSLMVFQGADSIRKNIQSPLPLSIERDDSWPSVFSRTILETAPTGTLAASDIGLIGQLTHYRVIDLVGLVDRHIAKSPGNSFQKDYDISYVLDQNPDFIILTDQRCLPESRIRNDRRFLNNYQFVKKHEAHSLYKKRAD
ncbi:MAG: hypothetical protein WCL71_00565 [Deltaproteobacteria bacterium]